MTNRGGEEERKESVQKERDGVAEATPWPMGVNDGGPLPFSLPINFEAQGPSLISYSVIYFAQAQLISGR